MLLSNIYDIPKFFFSQFLPLFSQFLMSYFDVFGCIFDICAMTDLPNVIVLICLVSYNFCMIPHVWRLTFGLNLSGAWGEDRGQLICGLKCGDGWRLSIIWQPSPRSPQPPSCTYTTGDLGCSILSYCMLELHAKSIPETFESSAICMGWVFVFESPTFKTFNISEIK